MPKREIAALCLSEVSFSQRALGVAGSKIAVDGLGIGVCGTLSHPCFAGQAITKVIKVRHLDPPAMQHPITGRCDGVLISCHRVGGAIIVSQYPEMRAHIGYSLYDDLIILHPEFRAAP
jgi:hypothetical protein